MVVEQETNSLRAWVGLCAALLRDPKTTNTCLAANQQNPTRRDGVRQGSNVQRVRSALAEMTRPAQPQSHRAYGSDGRPVNLMTCMKPLSDFVRLTRASVAPRYSGCCTWLWPQGAT
ncbi:MAG: hypothetical protein H7839_11830 [Magnetococcus sp. YQC-5]